MIVESCGHPMFYFFGIVIDLELTIGIVFLNIWLSVEFVITIRACPQSLFLFKLKLNFIKHLRYGIHLFFQKNLNSHPTYNSRFHILHMDHPIKVSRCSEQNFGRIPVRFELKSKRYLYSFLKCHFQEC